MATAEPQTTAVLLVTLGVLLGLSALGSRLAGRFGVPMGLLFLGVGMLAGSDGIGRIVFDDYRLTFRIGTAALALILFDGGWSTDFRHVRPALAPATVLATLGVVVTAGLTAAGAHWVGMPWQQAMLFGAVVASTDAAAVFSVLRGGGRGPQKRVAAVLELESGLNDPVAVLLTLALIQIQLGGSASIARVALGIGLHIVVGTAFGLGIGFGGRWLLQRARLLRGLYPVLTVALGLLAFGVPSLLSGSGFLAVYIAGLVMGNGKVPDRSGVTRVHDSMAWFCQIAMFLLLGLLVTPRDLLPVAPRAIEIALFLGFVARPAAVLLCLLPFGYSLREMMYVGWVGLRGAVPIILATFPVLAGVSGSGALFNLVFFVVVLNAHLPGFTVRAVTRWLRLESPEPPPPHALLEIASTEPLAGEVMSFYIEPACAAAGAAISELPFPAGAAVMLVIRGKQLIPPRGATVIMPGDHVYVFCLPQDKLDLQLLLGRMEIE